MNLKLLPNPAREKVTVEVEGTENVETILFLTDISGRIIMERKVEAGGSSIQLDLMELQSGLYYVVVHGCGFKRTEKLIVTR